MTLPLILLIGLSGLFLLIISFLIGFILGAKLAQARLQPNQPIQPPTNRSMQQTFF